MVKSDIMMARWSRCLDLGGRALQRGSSMSVDLGGLALFLRRCCSRSIETGMPERVLIHPSYNNGVWFYS